MLEKRIQETLSYGDPIKDRLMLEINAIISKISDRPLGPGIYGEYFSRREEIERELQAQDICIKNVQSQLEIIRTATENVELRCKGEDQEISGFVLRTRDLLPAATAVAGELDSNELEKVVEYYESLFDQMFSKFSGKEQPMDEKVEAVFQQFILQRNMVEHAEKRILTERQELEQAQALAEVENQEIIRLRAEISSVNNSLSEHQLQNQELSQEIEQQSVSASEAIKLSEELKEMKLMADFAEESSVMHEMKLSEAQQLIEREESEVFALNQTIKQQKSQKLTLEYQNQALETKVSELETELDQSAKEAVVATDLRQRLTEMEIEQENRLLRSEEAYQTCDVFSREIKTYHLAFGSQCSSVEYVEGKLKDIEAILSKMIGWHEETDVELKVSTATLKKCVSTFISGISKTVEDDRHVEQLLGEEISSLRAEISLNDSEIHQKNETISAQYSQIEVLRQQNAAEEQRSQQFIYESRGEQRDAASEADMSQMKSDAWAQSETPPTLESGMETDELWVSSGSLGEALDESRISGFLDALKADFGLQADSQQQETGVHVSVEVGAEDVMQVSRQASEQYGAQSARQICTLTIQQSSEQTDAQADAETGEWEEQADFEILMEVARDLRLENDELRADVRCKGREIDKLSRRIKELSENSPQELAAYDNLKAELQVYEKEIAHLKKEVQRYENYIQSLNLDNDEVVKIVIGEDSLESQKINELENLVHILQLQLCD